MERTLVLLKPDAVQRGLVGEIIMRFERAGLKIVGMKMIHPDEEYYHHHYETISGLKSRVGEDPYKRNIEFMTSSPVIAVVLEGIEAIALVRKMVGHTEPKSAAPGTIRGDYAHMSVDHANAKDRGLPNLIHASGDAKEAEEEIGHWFSEAELFDYKTAHQHLTQ
ncbi:TPA: nucleoside-diphosphate kinase [Candidatus Saccharibacteria bacterium]|nr:MAG: nucleoside-diphosphate kinase [Candidatus Saccharibacteria bacterium RIFCSPHIGHO2_12_FULL_47_17]HCM52076.1 nucleoside-diphosphate kinase [Candidatus Saccharibacteria bacterium]